MNKTVEIKVLRRLIANYMRSEGCGCCSSEEQHEIDEKELAKVLKVPMYSDKSGYNFGKFEDKKL